MLTVIPTFQRAGYVKTLNSFPWETFPHIALVVQHQEMLKYRSEYPRRMIWMMPADLDNCGIAKTRDWIIRQAHLIQERHVCMLDDDLDFAVRRTDEPGKFKAATLQDIHVMMHNIQHEMGNYHHVALAAREGGNRRVDPKYENGRAMRATAWDVRTLINEGIKFEEYPLMEDFGVTLELLTRGYPNLIINRWVHNQSGSAAPGGCSTLRTQQTQSAAAEHLYERFPKFVALVQKEGWNGATENRLDVRIQWKRAYEYGRKASAA